MTDLAAPARPRQSTGRAWSRKRAGRALANLALAAVLLFVLFPIAWLAQMSLRPDEDILGYQLLFEPIGGTPQQFSDYVRAEVAKWAAVVKTTGAKVD